MDIRPADAWAAALGQLELEIQRPTFDTWLRPSRFVSYDDGVFTISVENAYAKDWMEQRFYRKLQTTLSAVFGQKVELTFDVQNANPRRLRFAPPIQLEPLETLLADAHGTPSKTADLVATPIEKTPPISFAQEHNLNPNYTFKNFVVGAANNLAHAAAQAVLQNPGKSYSPLVIHGGVGLGKTHLAQAIGNAFQTQAYRALYLSAETFTNDLIRAIRLQKTEEFRQHYRNVDVLIIDDFQFIEGKESTQEEFFHTFNHLYNLNKQIVVALACAPNQLQYIDQRVRSRLEGGLAVEIQRPTTEMRYHMVLRKAQQQDVDLPDPVAKAIANEVDSSVRELEGVLNQVIAKAALTRQPITVEGVRSIKEIHTTSPTLDMETVLEGTATYHQLTLDDLLSKQRSKDIAMARHIAIYLAREELQASLPTIGRALGGRSHSTIINSCKQVEERLKAEPAFRFELDAVRQHIYNYQRQ